MDNFTKLIDQTYSYFVEEDSKDLKNLYFEDYMDFIQLQYQVQAGYDFLPKLAQMDTEPREQAYLALKADGLV